MKHRFYLKSGDQVYRTIIPKKGKAETEIKQVHGFTIMGIYYEGHPMESHHFYALSFYAAGYHQDGYAIVTKEKWHLWPAIVCEKIRLALPKPIAKILGLEA